MDLATGREFCVEVIPFITFIINTNATGEFATKLICIRLFLFLSLNITILACLMRSTMYISSESQ